MTVFIVLALCAIGYVLIEINKTLQELVNERRSKKR